MGWIDRQYAEHNLSTSSTIEQILAVAKPLLANPLTRLDGAELILGRRIDDAERNIALLLLTGDPNTIVGGLLIQKAAEELQEDTEGE